nr:hypothetical protein [Calliblepharis sp.]
MICIILNSSISWKSLPWKAVNQRIFILQEKIYKYAQRCNQYKVHKFQNYILNSSDIKIIAIQKVTNNINNYYHFYNKEKYLIKDIDKLYIYQHLFSTQKYSKKIEVVINYIKQYIVYLCIKPEWEARFEPIYKFQLHKLRRCYSIYKLSEFFSSQSIDNSCKVYFFSLFSEKNQKYQIIKRFIKRLHSLPSISYYINYWLNYQYIRCPLNIKKIPSRYYDSIPNYLEVLTYNILFNGIEWYLMYTLNIIMRAGNIFKNFYLIYNNNNQLEIYINNFILKQKFMNFLIKSIDSILKFYHLDSNYLCKYKKQNIYSFTHIKNEFNIIIQLNS